MRFVLILLFLNAVGFARRLLMKIYGVMGIAAGSICADGVILHVWRILMMLFFPMRKRPAFLSFLKNRAASEKIAFV